MALCTYGDSSVRRKSTKALLALAEQVAGVKSVSDETFPAY
jgi:hypothetical protein